MCTCKLSFFGSVKEIVVPNIKLNNKINPKCFNFCLLKLREEMLDIMTDIVKKVPTTTPQEVQVIAKGLTAVIHEGTELSSSGQVLHSEYPH